MTHRYIYPNPKDDRTWTREKWDQANRWCRAVSKIIGPEAERMAQRAMMDLMVYGTTPLARFEGTGQESFGRTHRE